MARQMLESVKIGFLVDSLLSRYQVRLLNGALRAAHRRGAHVIGFQGSFLRESEGAAFDGSFLYKLAGPQAVDGLIVASNTIASMVGTDFLSAFCAKSGLPVVSIGDLPGYPQVTIDSRAALRAAIVHLVNVHGRRRLAFIRGNHGNPDSAYREQIFRATLAELHVEVDERLVLPGTFLEGSGAQAIRVLFDDRGLGPGELQGVVSANDQMAVGAVRELRARQLRVPEDVAVIGFDDDDHARSNSPPLTTIAQPIEALAEHAVELLIDCLRGLAIPERVELLAKPVYRRSCGCLRAAGVDHLGATAHEPLAEALAACRPVCIKRLEKLLGAGADTSSVDILMRALLAGGEELVSAAFDEFERALLDACEVGLEPLTWHDVLVPLFEVVSRRLELDPGAAAETEQRLGRARQIVSEVAARTHSLARLREIQLANGLRIFGSALAAARSLPGVARALEAGLPGLGIGYFCVCLFVEGSDRSLAWQLVRHEACAARNEVLQDTVDLWRSLPGSLPPGEPREPLTSMVFPAHDLLRSGSEPKAENFHLLTYPLVFAERALGYVVFDAPNHVARPWLLENVAGHLSGAVYALAGADQLRDARLIAERANAAKSEFVAMMSHEVRTPLTAIAGHIELCLRTALSPEQKSHLKRARASSRALLRIVNDILDFSKLEAQRMELEVVPFDLDELLDQVLGNYALEASRRDLELVLDVLPGTPSSFRGDPLRLSQVLANLLSNAVKFTAAGHVLVRVNATELTADHCLLELTVHDTGIGMSDEELARIFKPFTQADSSTTRRYGGTGLGLSISKQLCDIMGGEIEATSRPP
ncbi:MAG: substrate-binding domain-containing protein, partial [Polyangiaceae bacterium]